ncbi:MAG: hypothetical protein LJE62_11890 [Silicimonas sp.]|nr:hypothetical protein [Silicimonas sp.]
MLVASSYDDKQILVFGPNSGLEVPILLNIESSTFSVRLPDAVELDQNFRREKSVAALKKRFPKWRKAIDGMVRFSKEATGLFTEAELDELTISDLRKRVSEAFHELEGAPKKTARAKNAINAARRGKARLPKISAPKAVEVYDIDNLNEDIVQSGMAATKGQMA